MNELLKKTITTLEVAEMMETDHWKLLRKLDGDKKTVGIIKILTDNNFVVSDYFIESTYKDTSGKENKCYEVTRLGCDFLANKSTGEKGILFTARYVKRFYEMENTIVEISPETIPIGEIANLSKVMDKIMVRQNSKPYEIAQAFELLCKQFGVKLPSNFVKIPTYEQLSIFNDIILN